MGGSCLTLIGCVSCGKCDAEVGLAVEVRSETIVLCLEVEEAVGAEAAKGMCLLISVVFLAYFGVDGVDDEIGEAGGLLGLGMGVLLRADADTKLQMLVSSLAKRIRLSS